MSAQHRDQFFFLPTQPPESFKKRQVSFARPVLFQTLTSTYANAPRSYGPRERVDQCGFANARFSCNKYYLSFSSQHLVEPTPHSRQGFVASDNSIREIRAAPRRS